MNPSETPKRFHQTEEPHLHDAQRENIWRTSEDLKMLRKMCNISKSTGEASHVNITETPFDETAGVPTLVEDITASLNLPDTADDSYVRALLSSRILRSMNALGVSPETVTHWRAENGTLVLLKKNEDEKITLGSFELFPSELSCKKEIVSKVQARPNQEEIPLVLGDKKPDVLLGSVDPSPHYLGKKFDAGWYRRKVSAAQTILQLAQEDRLLATAKAYTKHLITPLRALATMSESSTQQDFKKFENQFSDSDMFGGYGLYNVLLAFQRATGSRSIESPVRIEIRVGPKANSPADRYAEAWVLSERETLPTLREISKITPPKQQKLKEPILANTADTVPKAPSETPTNPLVGKEGLRAMRMMRRPLESIKTSLLENPFYETYISKAIRRWGLPPNAREIIKTWMQIEAGCNPRASRGGSRAPLGFSQATVGTQKAYWAENQAHWEEIRGVSMPRDPKHPEKIFFDPEIGIDVIAWYLKRSAAENRINISDSKKIMDLYMIHNMGGGGWYALKKYLRTKAPEDYEAIPALYRANSKNRDGEAIKKPDGTPLKVWENRMMVGRNAQNLYNAVYADAHKDDTLLTGGAH